MEYKAKCPKEGQPHYGCGICNVRPFLAPPPTTNPSTESIEDFRAKWEGANDYSNDRAISTPLMDALIKDVQALLSRKEEEVRENEKKHWLEGMCCTNCGGNKNPDGLSDMCGKCFEEA